MADREILLRWLATAATRLGWSRRVRDLGRLACALVALRLVAEVLEMLNVPGPVRSALTPLLIIAAVAVAAVFAWRLASSATLTHAAGAADARADLKDELRTAQWFAQRATSDAFVELLLTRAAQTVQRLDARRLFPIRAPRSMLGALTLVVFTGFVAWFSPHFALPIAPDPVGAITSATNRKAGDALNTNRIDKVVAELDSSKPAAREDATAAWAQLEQLAKDLPASAEKVPGGRTTASRDTRSLAQLLQALRRVRGVDAEPIARARPDVEGSASEPSVAARTPEGLSLRGETAREQIGNAGEDATARVRQQLSEQMREERRKLEGQPAQGEVTENNRLRAVSRNSASQREVAYAEGQAAQAGSQTSVDGPTKGEPTGKSRAGGSEGEQRQSTPTGEADTQPVLGEPTARLDAQLQRMKDPRNDNRRPQETEEAFYAATQRQVAQVGYQDVVVQPRWRSEATLPIGRTPLDYREAVKRYFLTQHRREE